MDVTNIQMWLIALGALISAVLIEARYDHQQSKQIEAIQTYIGMPKQ